MRGAGIGTAKADPSLTLGMTEKCHPEEQSDERLRSE
jgi:hypothetical protein